MKITVMKGNIVYTASMIFVFFLLESKGATDLGRS